MSALGEKNEHDTILGVLLLFFCNNADKIPRFKKLLSAEDVASVFNGP
ncbi:hypothetical protein ADICYQ_2867 [Cyclobacterium qasimii M12-11B]|uniref:Uncharacterized protein n=1 Tax=Cyclobacterium qasimii M12-11B TaxID=641524 RepID=S7VF29_9BACT|nr:hypothetical protein ADICYQ_2867 [Cyclobacterium qasimii M12-11B]